MQDPAHAAAPAAAAGHPNMDVDDGDDDEEVAAKQALFTNRHSNWMGDNHVKIQALIYAEELLKDAFYDMIRGGKEAVIAGLVILPTGETLLDAMNNMQIREQLVDCVMHALIRDSIMSLTRLPFINNFLAIKDPIRNGDASAYAQIMALKDNNEDRFKVWFKESATHGLFIYLIWMEKHLASDETTRKYKWKADCRLIGGPLDKALLIPAPA
jgi:hypothetical protein